MSTKTKSMYDYLKEEAKLDIEKVVAQAFSGAMGFQGLPTCVSDTATLRFRLMMSGQFPGPIDPILRKALVSQLQISQRFARLWTQDNPDLDKLIEVWQAQTEATARWVLLQSLLEGKTQLTEIEEAYHFALDHSPYEKLSFNLAEERAVWSKMLHNEQQRFVLLNQLEEAANPDTEQRLEGMYLVVQGKRHKLQPAQASLLTALWDGLPHSVSTLLLQAQGTRLASSDKIRNLGKRIADLNNRLDEIWGVPQEPGIRWIRQCPHPSETAYQLFKPCGPMRT